MSVSGDDLHDSEIEPAAVPTHRNRFVGPIVAISVALLACAILPVRVSVWASVIASACVAAYRLGCDKIGMMLWATAAGLASWPLCIVGSAGTSDQLVQQNPFSVVLPPVLLIAGLLRFLWAARRTATARGPNAAMIVIALFTLIIPVIVAEMISRARHDEEYFQETTQMVLGIHRVGSDIEAFRKAHGRLPKDEAEVVEWRGSPMPRWGEYGVVRYLPESDEQYSLVANASHIWGGGWDLFGYVVTSRGPRSDVAIHVELF